MFENVNEVAVLVSAILAMAVGSIWYSPLLFGGHWMRAIGVSVDELKVTRGKLALQLGLALVSSIAMLYVAAVFISFAKELSLPLSTLGLLLTVLLGALFACMVIWEQRPVSYFTINLGYAAVVIFGGLTVIWYWPW